MSLTGEESMSSILDNPTVRDAALRLLPGQYHQLCRAGIIQENTELIDGIVVKKMGKSPLHTWTVEFLADWFRARGQIGQCVRVEQPLTLSASEPEPDIAIVSGSRDDFRTAHPDTARLVIEVAVSSEDIDREKAAIYCDAGIPEYWLVLPGKQEVTVYRDAKNGTYGTAVTYQSDVSLQFDGSQVLLADLFKVNTK
jgi:Uma2 family endonuclease